MTATNDNPLCDIGFIGLGVMGKNLCLNLADHGYRIACLDLDQNKVDAMLQQDALESKGQSARMQGCNSYKSLLAALKAPYVIMLSVPAGEAVDHVCFNLIKAGVKPEDIVIDTGNSLWTDSIEREKKYAEDFCFFSTAVSGGEVGARFGPSLMPSGSAEAWQRIEPIFHAIAAKVDPDTGLPIESNQPGKPVTQGEPCATLIGPIGAGHYVKMVHNGIEYADMQIICEAYHIMRSALSMAPQEIAQVFRQWNDGILNSYLMQISASVLEHIDPDSQQPLVDVILDVAGQKGTGVWTGISALEIGSPAQTINQAVMARSLSGLKNERVLASQCLAGPQPAPVTPEQKQSMIEALKHALYCSKVCAYAQGFQLMAQAGDQYQWTLNFAEIAKIWRAGCIIRANFLQSITQAYEQKPQLTNLLLAPYFAGKTSEYQHDWRQTISYAVLNGVPCPAMMSALSYYDAYRSEVLPANLLQAQRDFFGAHCFQRNDQPDSHRYHIQWNTDEKKQVCYENKA